MQKDRFNSYKRYYNVSIVESTKIPLKNVQQQLIMLRLEEVIRQNAKIIFPHRGITNTESLSFLKYFYGGIGRRNRFKNDKISVQI